jgi:hypothetical protein
MASGNTPFLQTPYPQLTTRSLAWALLGRDSSIAGAGPGDRNALKQMK